MKSITLADARSDLNRVLDDAQKDRILITRAGKPSVMILGVESYDEEDWRLAASPEFWQMIEERRRSNDPGIPLAEARVRLGLKPKTQRSSRPGKTNGKRPKSKQRTRN